jgi:TRAP-type C4-dicarboxylate transport system permease small subunit
MTRASGARFGDHPLVRKLHSFRRRLYQALEAVIFVLVLMVLAFVFTQVFTRYVLHAPVNWLEEAARMTLVWLVMLGAAVAAERREHYLINVITNLLPETVARVVLVVTNVIALGFLVVLTVKGFEYFQSGMTSYYVSLNVPRGYIYIAVPIGAILMTFSLATQSIEACLAPDLGSAKPASPETAALSHE